MAGHPQSSFRGLFWKNQIRTATLEFDTAPSTAKITDNSSGIVLAGAVKVSNARHLSANSTGFVLDAESAIPATDNGAAFTIISNSTGVALAVNTTGTTWKYLDVTSVQGT